MTIADALNLVDTQKYNNFCTAEKISWLSELESQIYRELVATHEDAPASPFVPFTMDTPLDTVLFAPEPYDQVYLHQLEMKMDYYSGEIEKYLNSRALRSAFYDALRSWYNRSHLPKTASWRFP